MSQSSSTNSSGVGRHGGGGGGSSAASNTTSGAGNPNNPNTGSSTTNTTGRSSGTSGTRLNANSADYVISSMGGPGRNLYGFGDGYGSEYSPTSADAMDFAPHHPSHPHSHHAAHHSHHHSHHPHGHHHNPGSMHMPPQGQSGGYGHMSGQRMGGLGGGAGISPEYFDIRSHDAYGQGPAGYGSNSTSMGGYYDPLGRAGALGGTSGGLGGTSGTLGGAGMGSSGAGGGGTGATVSGGVGSALDLSSPSSDRRKQAVYDSEPPAQPSAMALAGGSGGLAMSNNPALIGGRYNTTLPAAARLVLRAGSRFGSVTLTSNDAGLPTPQLLASLASGGTSQSATSGVAAGGATTAASTPTTLGTSTPAASAKGKGRSATDKAAERAAAAAAASSSNTTLPLLALPPTSVESVFAGTAMASAGNAPTSSGSSSVPEQIAIEHFTLPLDQPVEDCVITPYISLRYGNSIMLAKPPSTNNKAAAAESKDAKEAKDAKDAKEPLRADKLIDVVWSRGRRRVCAVPDCGKNATMQCLTSVKAGIPLESTMFCSPQCLEANWKNKRQSLTSAVLDRQIPCGVSPSGNMDSEHVPFKCLEDYAGDASLTPRPAGSQSQQPEGPQRTSGKQSQATQNQQQLKRRGAAPLRSSAATASATNVALFPFSGEWFADEDLHPQMQEELMQRLSTSGSVSSANNPAVLALAMKRYEGLACRYPAQLPDIFTPVYSGWSYTPSAADVGCAIRVDVSPVVILPKGFTEQDAVAAWSDPNLKRWTRLEMAPTLPLPAPRPPRPVVSAPVPAQGAPALAHLPFKVFNYNILSPQYTTSQMYPYCPPYALAWPYRYRLIMREIAAANPDIICLQEVLQSCYADQMEAALIARGYQSLFRGKQREAEDVDGCAILFRKSKFTLVESRLIDFNQLAQHRSLSLVAQRRIARGNIGLAVVLEVNSQGFASGSGNITSATVSGTGVATSSSTASSSSASSTTAKGQQARSGPPRRFCVANTHVYWDPEYADVKLWQTWQLCRELDDIVKSGRPDEIPLVLCGDFNSLPSSSVYKLLTTQHVPRTHPIFKNDRNGVLPPPHNLNHKLVLSSAYATAMNDEPPYTNYAGDFQGVLEYIMYTHKSLMCTAVLGMEPESVHKEYTALPSPHFPSDHISLVAHFDFVDR